MSDNANCIKIGRLAEGSLKLCHGGFELFKREKKSNRVQTRSTDNKPAQCRLFASLGGVPGPLHCDYALVYRPRSQVERVLDGSLRTCNVMGNVKWVVRSEHSEKANVPLMYRGFWSAIQGL